MNGIEYSIRDNVLYIRPGQLCCIRCLLGGGSDQVPEYETVDNAVKAIKANSDIHICLHTAFDEIGARTDMFDKLTASERLFDLTVLQRLGLVPYSIRTARELFDILNIKIPKINDLCVGTDNPEKWPTCPLSDGASYDKKITPVMKRDLVEKSLIKKESCEQIEKADRIFIRIHHILCITCFLQKEDATVPIEEDNLFEVWDKMLNNPDIPVTLMEGCNSCMVCPPCHAFDMERGICNGACGLRDRKKDLDTFKKMGMLPGETYPARELLYKIYSTIDTTRGICDYGEDTAYEWKACGGGGDNYKRYQKGRAYAIKRLGFDL